MNYEKLNKRARGCMMVSELIITMIGTMVILIPRICFENELAFIPPFVVYGVLIFMWVLAFTAPVIRYNRYRYRFTDEEIDVKEGLIFIERNVVPIERLHQVAMRSGPIDRMFGLTKVIVTTAGGEVTIRFLEQEKAEGIVENLKHRINQYAREKREYIGTEE